MQKQNFKKALGVLKDMKIVLFLSDNQFVEGIVLDVKQDHLVVNVNQNVFYFAFEHIQGLSKNSKGFRVSPQIVPYLNQDTLADVLRALQYNWVSINSLGKQAFFGMLSKISEDHIILIDNMEQLYIQKSYISNIYKGKYEIYDRNAHIGLELAIQESSSYIIVETIEQLDSSLEEEIEHVQDNEQVIVKQIQTTNKNESEKYVEVPINVKLAEVETDSVNVTSDHIEIRPMTKIVNEPSSLQLDTRELVDKSEDNERHEEPSQERIIRDIASRINDESKEQSDSTTEEEIQVSQDNEQVILKQIQTTIKNETEKYVEVPINVKPTEVKTDSVNVTNEHIEIHPITEIVNEPSSIQLDTQDLVDESEDNDRHEEPSREIIIRDIASRMNDKSKEQSDSLTEEIKVNQHNDQVISKHIQLKSIKEFEKYAKTAIMKNHFRKKMGDANVTNKNLEVQQKTEVMEEFNIPHLDKQDLLNMDEKKSLEMDHRDVIKSKKNIFSEEQYMLTKQRFRHKKKRKLITTWCTIKNNQHAISQKQLDGESKFPTHEEDSNKVAHRSRRFKSLNQPTVNNISSNKLKSDENFDLSGGKPKPTETNTSPIPLRQINPKEEKAILEKQYYALMKHASRNSLEMKHCSESSIPLETYFLPVRQISHNEEAMIKKQYNSLMKHAERMYYELKGERIKKNLTARKYSKKKIQSSPSYHACTM